MHERTLPVALVLGARVLDGGRPSSALRRRAEHAAHLWLAGRVRAIVVSGGDRWGGPSEARVMADLCRALGVPEAALALEARAATTEQNIALARPMLEALETDALLLVTDWPHSLRARLVARRQGWARVRVSCPSVPFRARVLRHWAREALALLWYWLSGKGRRRRAG